MMGAGSATLDEFSFTNIFWVARFQRPTESMAADQFAIGLGKVDLGFVRTKQTNISREVPNYAPDNLILRRRIGLGLLFCA